MSIYFTIPIKTVSGLNVREHWSVRARRVKAERKATALCFPKFLRLRLKDNALTRVRITLIRVGKGKLDSDNLPGSMKGVRDELARLLGLDDGSDRYEWVYRQERGVTQVLVHAEWMDPEATK